MIVYNDYRGSSDIALFLSKRFVLASLDILIDHHPKNEESCHKEAEFFRFSLEGYRGQKRDIKTVRQKAFDAP